MQQQRFNTEQISRGGVSATEGESGVASVAQGGSGLPLTREAAVIRRSLDTDQSFNRLCVAMSSLGQHITGESGLRELTSLMDVFCSTTEVVALDIAHTHNGCYDYKEVDRCTGVLQGLRKDITPEYRKIIGQLGNQIITKTKDKERDSEIAEISDREMRNTEGITNCLKWLSATFTATWTATSTIIAATVTCDKGCGGQIILFKSLAVIGSLVALCFSLAIAYYSTKMNESYKKALEIAKKKN